MQKWDREVDLVSIGAGVGGLAGAIATVDAGCDVLVADAPPVRVNRGSGVVTRRRVQACGWLITEATDAETADYFAEFAAWVPGSAYVARDVPVPTRVVSAVREGEIEPFIGSRLSDWARAVPHVALRHAPLPRLRQGGPHDASSRRRDRRGVADRLDRLARRHGRAGTAGLDGRPGAQSRRGRADRCATAPAGVRRRTRRRRRVRHTGWTHGGACPQGISVAPTEHEGSAGEPVGGVGGEQRQVCLVGRTASRFGRVEILRTAEPDAGTRSPCSAVHRALRDARFSRSGPGHCRKVN
jgi:hypothetical protein